MKVKRDDGLGEARGALKQACPQVPDREIDRALRDLKRRNRRHGGA